MKKLLSFFVSGIIAMSVFITGGIVAGAEVVNEPVTYTIQDIHYVRIGRK